MLRLLLWRLLGFVALIIAIALTFWMLDGGLAVALRGASAHRAPPVSIALLIRALAAGVTAALRWAPAAGAPSLGPLVAALLPLAMLVGASRGLARRRRAYVRLEVEAYRADTTSVERLVATFESLHKRLMLRWWRRLLRGQPSLALEVHHAGAAAPTGDRSSHELWLAVSCPTGLEAMVETALRGAYPNCRLRCMREQLPPARVVLRLKKRSGFIKRVKLLDRFEDAREPPMNRLLSVMAACQEAALVQLALTPAPVLFERYARHLYKRHEVQLSRTRREHLLMRDRSIVEDVELRGGLDVQHRPLFFADLRVIAPSRATCERIASELRAAGAENRLVERGTALRHGLLGIYERRVQRGEGNPLPSFHKGVFAATELAGVWQLPSIDFAVAPFARTGLPCAPAPPTIMRPGAGPGTLRDALGAVTIHPELRKQNTAVPGAVEQGKSSYLVATVAEDLRRERCALIVLDPKGDAAEAAVSLVPAGRTCTVLDFAHPTCGFNPLAVDAPADVIADYVVAALKNLFTDADIRASSDRYLRNAIIAVLAYDRGSTLWDAARLLSVGEDGYAYRSAVGTRLRAMPEFSEISAFYTAELTAQLADARSTTTAKLDAPVNKLARLLNSPSIKRVLLNESLRVDFDEVIARHEVLVVKGALGAMGAGNTSVLMQLLIGMLDAALARQQDLVPAAQRVAVALKVDEAPLVLNRGFAETMALKRSAGLETVACWQTEAQWSDPQVRDQLDALFAHRVYFATSSARDARSAIGLTMAEFSDSVRPGIERISTLGRPDARLHLPKHHAIASWITPQGRQAPFVAETVPLGVDRERLLLHAARQADRGGRHRGDLRQPHWEVKSRAAKRGQTDAPTAAEQRPPRRARPLSSTPPESFRELVELDRAHSVRWAQPAARPRALKPEPLDLEILAFVANLRHALTSQIHRRFNARRAMTTTQRRLKRLSDAGLLERFQFHRRDGGGVPMCYLATTAARELLGQQAPLLRSGGIDGQLTPAPVSVGSPRAVDATTLRADRRGLREARRDVHVAGWTLALEHALEPSAVTIRGPADCALSPPYRRANGLRTAIGPRELRLPSGRTPHGFVRTCADGERIEVERFETVRPHAIVELAGPRIDVLVEFDDRLEPAPATAKLERYDHFVAGWATHTQRYGSQRQAKPLVVFVCRNRARARECARRADAVLGACRAYAGEYPFDWEYPGREAIAFASERDAHEGLTHAYGVPRLPPPVRVSAAHGDPHARRAAARELDIAPTTEDVAGGR